MDDSHELTYRDTIATDAARQRVEELLKIAEAFYPDAAEDVFISEYRETDGRQIIEGVWLFTGNYAMEFKNPLGADETFDLAILKHSVRYLQASKKEFDLRESSDASRFTLNFSLTAGVTGELRATGPNCVRLLRIAQQYFFPNVALPSRHDAETSDVEEESF